MITRYNLFAETGVRDLKGYNSYISENRRPPAEGGEAGPPELLPQIVIIVDELADLMMAAPGEVEDAICRLAQMARAAGIHLIIATQRPSVDVITGLIKANIPSRLAFAVSSGTDSRTVLDMTGAEKLLGKGDMLFFPVGMGKPLRVQGAYISDKEIENIVNFVKAGQTASYDQEMIDKITMSNKLGDTDGEVDEFFDEAIEFIIQKDKASASMLQRQFRIGYNRASRLIEDLEARGVISAEDGSKPRKVLMTPAQWREYRDGE
jgi:S-DNA-T family DNA segregation ATPase FtsK/SpoIIIE